MVKRNDFRTNCIAYHLNKVDVGFYFCRDLIKRLEPSDFIDKSGIKYITLIMRDKISKKNN